MLADEFMHSASNSVMYFDYISDHLKSEVPHGQLCLTGNTAV